MTRCIPFHVLSLATLLLAVPAGAQDTAQSTGLSMSGDARMGIAYERAPDWAARETGLRMTSRARIKLRFIGETDGGVRFGGELRLDESRENRPTGHVTFGE